MKVSTKGGGQYPLFQLFKGRPGSHTFSRIFNRDFCDVTFHFSFQLVSFNLVQVLVLQGYWVSTCILFHGT